MIEVQSLTKIYGKKENAFKALDEATFTIPEGSTAAIIGKSGSGKSTLMHIMSGLDHPTRGSVTIGKRHMQTLKQKEIDKFRARDMSFIFQAFFIEPNQTCFQNVMLPLEIAKVSRRKRRAKVLAALARVDLSEKANSRARDLSGGQKQRLAIARAIVNEPKLIFADEPTGNLDSVTGEKIIELLFSLNETIGSTLIIVTHDTELARRCQMQIIIKDGRVEHILEHGRAVRGAPRPAEAPPSNRAQAARPGTVRPAVKPARPTVVKPQRPTQTLKPTKPLPRPTFRPLQPKPPAVKKPLNGTPPKKGVRYVS